MNWEAIGAVGEAVGAAGVIISLLYLAVQIRGDARAKRIATVHEQSVASGEVFLHLADNPGLADLFIRGLGDLRPLSGADLSRFSALLGYICRMWEDQFFQWSEGHLDQDMWRGVEASLDDVFAYPGIQAWWRTRSHWFSGQFQALIEKKIAEGKAPSMYGEATA